MAVTKEQKNLYNEKIKSYKSGLEDIKKEISMVKSVGKKNAKVDPYAQIRLGILSMQTANTLVLMSRLSQKIQNLKNDGYLNDARKEISSKLNDLLKLVGDDIDISVTDSKDRLKLIEKMTVQQRMTLLLGFKEAMENVKESLGENAKWRWSFPDMHFKLALLAKNMFDFKEHGASKDPNDEQYRPRQEMLKFIIEESQFAAQEFRSKFELSTKDVSDLENVRRIFEMLKKVYMITGNRTELDKLNISNESIKEKIDLMMAEKAGKKKKGQ